MMQYEVKKVFQSVMYTIKIAIVSFLGNRNHNIIFLSWELFVFISLVMQKYSKWLLADTINNLFKFLAPFVYTFRFQKKIKIIHTSPATIPIWHCLSLTWLDRNLYRVSWMLICLFIPQILLHIYLIVDGNLYAIYEEMLTLVELQRI